MSLFPSSLYHCRCHLIYSGRQTSPHFGMICGRTSRGHTTGGTPHRFFYYCYYYFNYSALLLRCLLYFFIARKKIQPSLYLVDREVDFLCNHDINRSPLVWHDVRENPSSYDCAEIRTSNSRPNVRRFRDYQLNQHRGDRYVLRFPSRWCFSTL